MLKRQYITVALVLAALTAVHPQNRRDTTHIGGGAYRVERCEKYCSYPAPLGEAVLNANGLFQEDTPDSGKLLVRVCSKEAMPVAVATAAIEPDDIVQLTRGFESGAFKLRPENIIVGRSEECSGKSPNVTPAELLAVPQSATTPPVSESIRACQVRTRRIALGGGDGSRIRAHEAAGLRKSVERLVAELRRDPQATGFVLGYRLKNETKQMRTRLQEAKRMLARSGLPAARYVVRAIPQYGYDATTPAEADFFSVKTVQIMPECSPSKDREVLAAE